MINKEVVKEQLAKNQERIMYAQETVKRINEEKVNEVEPVKAKQGIGVR